MVAAQKFVENIYYHDLAGSLVIFGWQIQIHQEKMVGDEGFEPPTHSV
jgi:hypothetical protein